MDRRFAFRILSLPGVAKSTYGVIIAFGAIAAIISSVISNTTVCAMLLPIALGMMGVLGGLVSEQADDDVADVSRLRFGTALMLMISYGAGVGGLLTPIGTAPNLIGIAFIEQATDINISFFEWMLTAAPVVVPMFILLCIILILLNRPEVRRISGAEEYVNEERRKLGPFSPGERNTMIVFAVAVSLWLLPGVIALTFGDESTAYSVIYTRLDEGTVAIIADTFGFTSVVAVSAVSAVIAVLISETTSNTASATIVVPIVIPVATAAGLDPLVPALCALFACSFGFMMPVSTPQNAVVYGSGMIPITKMVRSGIVFDVIGLALIVLLVPIMATLIIA